MPSEQSPDVKFEIGHVLFIDIVGYSKLLINQQSERLAMAVVPIEKDALDGPMPIEILARVAAQTGEPDRAIAALQKLLSIPYEAPLAEDLPLTPALLRLDPMFDPLRKDPRFQKLVASPTPK